MALKNTVTQTEFKQHVIDNDKTVLVDFWAEWCPPCRAMAPVLEDVANDLADTVDIVKVDIEASDDNKQLAGEHQVQSIPNMIVFKGGKEVDRIIGMTPRDGLKERLKNA